MKEERLKIFVSAYACEPGLGSEIGVGWHWILEMNKYFDLWVLTREKNRPTIESWLSRNKLNHEIHFIYYDTPYWMRWWKKGLRGVRIYYTLWQHLTNNIVKDIMVKENIKIYHLLTYGNSLWPASKFGQKQFFIWGPTGGVDSIPFDYFRHYSFKWKLIELTRRAIVKLLPYNLGFITRCKNANLILCKSNSLLENIPHKYKVKARLFTDVAVEIKDINKYHSTRSNDDLVKFLIVGRLDGWRGFDILIEAFFLAYKVNKNIRLDIIGGGSERNRLFKLISRLRLNNIITMHGQVSMDEYHQFMIDCDVVCNPSLKEGAVTTAFDSMSFGKPLICIDTGGYTKYFNNEYAIILQRKRRSEVIQMLAASILKMTDSSYRKQLGERSKSVSYEYTWEIKGQSIYETITNSYDKYRSVNI